MTLRNLSCYLLKMLCLCAFSTQLFAVTYNDEQKTLAERYIDKQVKVLQQSIVERRETDLRIKIASSPLIEALAVWEPNGKLMFPDDKSESYTNDYIFLRSESRLVSLLASTTLTAWERYDVNTASLLYCQKNMLSICAVINTDELVIALDTTKEELLDGIFHADRSTFTGATNLFGFLSVLVLVLAAALFIGWNIFYRKKGAEVTFEPRAFLTMGDMEIDPKRMLVVRGDLTVNISARDLKLLTCFVEHPDEVISKDKLYDAGWGRDFVPSSRALEQHIMTLRKKIDPDRQRKSLIDTVHGQGYRYPTA